MSSHMKRRGQVSEEIFARPPMKGVSMGGQGQAESIAAVLLEDEDEARAAHKRQEGPRFKPTLPHLKFMEGIGPERYGR